MVSFTVILWPFQSPVALIISSPNVLRDRPRMPVLEDTAGGHHLPDPCTSGIRLWSLGQTSVAWWVRLVLDEPTFRTTKESSTLASSEKPKAISKSLHSLFLRELRILKHFHMVPFELFSTRYWKIKYLYTKCSRFFFFAFKFWLAK